MKGYCYLAIFELAVNLVTIRQLIPQTETVYNRLDLNYLYRKY